MSTNPIHPTWKTAPYEASFNPTPAMLAELRRCHSMKLSDITKQNFHICQGDDGMEYIRLNLADWYKMVNRAGDLEKQDEAMSAILESAYEAATNSRI